MSEKEEKAKMQIRREKKKIRRKQRKFSIFDLIVCIIASLLLIGVIYYFYCQRDARKFEQKSKNHKSKFVNVNIKNKMKRDDGNKTENVIKPKNKIVKQGNDPNNSGGTIEGNGGESNHEDESPEVEDINSDQPINPSVNFNKSEDKTQIIDEEEREVVNQDSDNSLKQGNPDEVKAAKKKKEPTAENSDPIPPVEKDMYEYGDLPPILLAIKKYNLEVFKNAIKTIPNLKTEMSGNGFNALHYAASLMRVDIMRYIIENKLLEVKEAIKDDEYAGNTALHWVCLAAETYPDRAIEAVELLLSNGADINALDANGFSPIFCAVQSGHTKLVEHLLSKDASLIKSRIPDDDSTLLHFAMGSCHRPMLKLLIEKDADMMHAVNNLNREPIHEAAAVGCVDGLKELILTQRISKQLKSPAKKENKYKSDYEDYCLFGAAPLHFAAKFKQLMAVEFLFLIQSEFNATDEDHKTASEYAAKYGNSKFEEYFEERKSWEKNMQQTHKNISDVESELRTFEQRNDGKMDSKYEIYMNFYLHKRLNDI